MPYAIILWEVKDKEEFQRDMDCSQLDGEKWLYIEDATDVPNELERLCGAVNLE